MKKREGTFSLSDNVFNHYEKDLITIFLQKLAKQYHIDLSENEFKFKCVGVGLSKSTKILALSDEVYPYFIKIADDRSIDKELSNFNRSSARIPPLHIPPLETVIKSDHSKVNKVVNSGYSLLAVRYITDSSKGEAPLSLFEAFSKLNVYESIELVDELFQVVLKDLHAFHRLKEGSYKNFEPFIHNAEILGSLKDATLDSMVERYNDLASTAKTCILPHGHLHGDLHCENIILNSRLMPVIIDFEMMRTDGCLLNDFAEFEIALTVAALDADVELYGTSIKNCYTGASIFEFFGVDKIIRSIRAIRANLAHQMFNVANITPSKNFMASFEYVYRLLLLRYICSYTWVSINSLSVKRRLVIVSILSTIFDQLYEAMEDTA